jgi:hypothetical protein
MINVSINDWPHTHTEPKDANATLDYTLDWSSWLPSGVKIVGLELFTRGFTVLDSTYTDTTTTAWISGGKPGINESLQFRITTDSSPVALVDDRTLLIPVKQR